MVDATTMETAALAHSVTLMVQGHVFLALLMATHVMAQAVAVESVTLRSRVRVLIAWLMAPVAIR